MRLLLRSLASVMLFAASALAHAATTYTYDELNRLTKVQYDDGRSISYAYDAVGNLVSTRHDAPSGSLPRRVPHSGAQRCFLPGRVIGACTATAAQSVSTQQDGMRISFNTMAFEPVASQPASDCLRDKMTGLVWEVKTLDSSIRNRNQKFYNYDDASKPQKWDGNPYSPVFTKPTLAEISAETNSIGYVNYVNSIRLCGFTDWRQATVNELQDLNDYSNGRVFTGLNNVDFGGYWSNDDWQMVYVANGYADSIYERLNYRNKMSYLRLVRGEE